MSTRLIRLILSAFVLLCTVTPAAAQGGSGTTSLGGTVIDSAGGAIPGAAVAVRNNATGATFETATNSVGAFSVPALDPGTYTVTVSLSGFKTAVVSDVRLLAAVPGNVKATLEVGNLSETVQVRGGSELVQTQSTTVASTINTEQMANLPAPTRNALHFVPFLAGVDTAPGASVRDSTINGLPESSINITIDGVNVNNNMQRNTDGFYSMIRPNLDAIEAVTVTGATPGADSAGQGAVQIRFVTRSGTNEFRGSGYHYFRHPNLNSNYFFNKVNGLERNRIILHQYGGRVGGPIVIPGLVDGRNKAFFFVNHEELWQPTEATRTRTLLHPLAQQGIFRYNVNIGAQTEVREVDLLALARANNQLATLDPTVAALLTQIRTAAGSSGTITQNPNPLTQQYVFLSPGDFNEHLPTTRIDVNVTDKHRLSGTYVWQQVDRSPDIQNSEDPQFPGFPNIGLYHSYRTTGSVTLRSTFSSNRVNELLVGWQWSPGYFNTNVDRTQFDNQGGFNLGLPFASSATTANGPNARNTINWNIDDSINWLKGTHSLSFGTSFTEINHWESNWSAVPDITFGVQATLDPADAMFIPANFQSASNANINDARNLYALLTGRVTAINGTARLDEQTKQYEYLGRRDQRVLMRTAGLFAQDSWRYHPTLTFNYGLRWEVQMPFQANNSTYSTTTIADLCGISGVGSGPGGRPCNMFKPNMLTGALPQYVEYGSGTRGYDIDWNNVAPNGGVAWRPNAHGGFLKSLLGDPEQAVVRGGYSLAFNRAGTQEFTGVYGANPGSTINTNRSNALGNLVLAGQTWPVLLRDRDRLGPPSFPASPVYPLPGTIAQSLSIFDPAIQVPYTHSWSAGLQRALSKDMAIEVRYVGTRNRKGWTSENWNEINVVENGFAEEFRKAQANLQANIAAGRGNTFAYTGAPGTSPLPIFLAHYNGVPMAQAGDSARYTGNNWTNTTFLSFLAVHNPSLFSFASTNANNGLYGNATFRNAAISAGLPRNFWVMNPDVSSANITRSAGRTRYDALQIELRRRLSQGLHVQANYTYSVKDLSALDTLRKERVMVQATSSNTNSARIPHAFKVNWVYESPVGRGKRFGTNMNPWLNGIIGDWEFSGIGRVQTGRILTLTDVKLVGMSEKELQDVFKIRIERDAEGVVTVWNLPQDIIDNTRRAFSTDATSASGYSALGVPTGRYLAPASGPDCLALVLGDCGPRNLFVRGPVYSRFDFSLKKKLPFAKRGSFDLQVDVLNVFDAINFIPVFETGTGATINQVDTAFTDVSQQFDPGGRLAQIIWRVNW